MKSRKRGRPTRQTNEHTRMPTTNAKPRDEFAGLHRFATCRGLTWSRHRDARRPVVTGFRVVLSEASSIGPPSIHDFTLRLAIPAGTQVARLASRPLSSAPVPRFGIILKPSCRGWSLPVRFRYTRNTGRAQQRNIKATTGSSVVVLRIHPEPNHRSSFSWRLSPVLVKAYLRPIAR